MSGATRLSRADEFIASVERADAQVCSRPGERNRGAQRDESQGSPRGGVVRLGRLVRMRRLGGGWRSRSRCGPQVQVEYLPGGEAYRAGESDAPRISEDNRVHARTHIQSNWGGGASNPRDVDPGTSGGQDDHVPEHGAKRDQTRLRGLARIGREVIVLHGQSVRVGRSLWLVGGFPRHRGIERRRSAWSTTVRLLERGSRCDVVPTGGGSACGFEQLGSCRSRPIGTAHARRREDKGEDAEQDRTTHKHSVTA